MTHPNTDQGVTAEDREAAAALIENYWPGFDAAMMKLAASYRSGRTQGVFVEAFTRHRLSSTAALEAEIASLKQRLESAEDALRPFAMALHEWGDDAGQPDRWNVWEHPIANGVTLGDFRSAAHFLQEQEKQNG